MKTIKVKFEETVEYEVEFIVDDDVDVDESGWFGVMDEAKPDWATQSKVDVIDRQLIELDVPNDLLK
jgi:hypothetical protein